MELFVFGLNHNSAPLELREALYFDDPAMTAFMRGWAAREGKSGIVGLSTCNRTEFYIASRHPEAHRERLLETLVSARGVESGHLRAHAYSFQDAEAIGHLCRVAAGIDSLVVGEDQILAQVKQAYRRAIDLGCAGAFLHLAFERALRVAKRVRTETRVNEGAVSVASVAVALVKKIFDNLAHCQALLLGAGETGELVARSLLSNGLTSLVVANRTPERARALAEAFGARTAHFSKLEEALASADIVICATGAPEPILTAEMLSRAMDRRDGRMLAAIDISVPRNIDPRADSIEQLFVYDMDALEEVCEENRRRRRAEIGKAEAIVEGETQRFVSWSASLDAQWIIAALRRRMEAIRQSEIERYGRSFPAAERPKLDRFSRSLLNKALHDLTLNLKSLDLESDDGLLEFDALCRALNLEASSGESEAADADAAPSDPY